MCKHGQMSKLTGHTGQGCFDISVENLADTPDQSLRIFFIPVFSQSKIMPTRAILKSTNYFLIFGKYFLNEMHTPVP